MFTADLNIFSVDSVIFEIVEIDTIIKHVSNEVYQPTKCFNFSIWKICY